MRDRLKKITTGCKSGSTFQVDSQEGSFDKRETRPKQGDLSKEVEYQKMQNVEQLLQLTKK